MPSLTASVPLRSALAVLGALALALALLVAPAQAQQPEDEERVTPDRVSGADRFATAAAIATATFPQADVAVLATGENYPDALAASFAAGSAEGPLLLTARTEAPPSTLAALDELGVGTVVLVGGQAAIDQAVAAQLEGEGYDVERVSGVNRFQTASAIAMRYGTTVGVGTVDGDRTALLASGEAFPDALAVGPLAAGANLPLFLTPRDTTEVSVNQSLEQLAIERIIVVGGTAAVSADVVERYQDAGYEVERFAGASRTETAVVVAQNAIERFDDLSAAAVLLARGDDYPDALAASIHGAVIGAPILLTANPTVLSPATEGWLFDTCPAIEVVRAVGGTAAVTDQALNEAVLAAGQCLDDAPDWATCTNAEDGYTVDHPADWATNDERMNTVPPCSLFDPDPEQLRIEGMEVPTDIAVFLRVEDIPFDEVSGPALGEDAISGPHERTVDGRTAERIEVRADGTGFLPEGTVSARWVVDLDGRSLIAVSNDIGDPTYQEKIAVLDQMMETVVFDDPADGPEELIGPASLEPRDSGDMPRDNAPAYLTDVRTGVHDGFDRVTLELDGDERPGWQVTWDEEPILLDPSAQPIDVRGEAFLRSSCTSPAPPTRSSTPPIRGRTASRSTGTTSPRS
jgi:putative cell wall-binding protein